MIKKKEFVRYNDEVVDKKLIPMPVKLNEADNEMISIGRYAYNMESKSGVLKFLAHKGLKVLLYQEGVEEMHKLTNGLRRRLIQEKPKYKHFLEQLQKR